MPTPSSRASCNTRSVIPTLFSWPRMSTNQRWIISTPFSSQNFTISFFDFRLSIRSVPPSSLRCLASSTQHHRHGRLRLEAELLVEPVLVLGQQEKARDRLEVGVIQDRANQLRADSVRLMR